MSKVDIDLIYKAIDELDLPDDAEVRRVVDYAMKLQQSEKEGKEKEPGTRDKKGMLVVTNEPLKEPILGWVLQKELVSETMLTEDGTYEEVAPSNWGDLEAAARIDEVRRKYNNDPRRRKKKGLLTCVGDVMEYAPKKLTKECGFVVKTKIPIAIVSLSTVRFADEDETDNEE